MRTFAKAKASLFLAVSLSFSAQASESLLSTVQTLISESLNQPHNRVQVKLGNYAQKLAGCEAPAVFLPFRVNAGGRATVGLRCLGREQRPLYLTADVEVTGRYWVANDDISRGTVIERSMISEKTGDLSKLPRNILQDPEKIMGQQVNRVLRAGKPVQKTALQAVYLVKRNAAVDVQAVGVGFTIKRDGIAMDDGALGDLLRVKLKAGNTVKATVTAKNVLNIDI
jgi:flagella basal body P-ring formation protein FlgA